MSFAYATLLYSDNYLPGALVLAHSLISQNSIIDRAILITSEVSQTAISELSKVYTHIIKVDPIIANGSTPGFQLLNRPELLNAYTKIHIWNQTQFSKVVFLDADTLPIKNIDDLFSNRWLEENETDKIAACPDIGWPDIFNSGVFITIPNEETFKQLSIRAQDGSGKYSFDGGDQGLLNQYFTENSNWKRLPFIYNVTPSTSYQYLPAYSYYESQVSIVHFIGSVKPWQGDAAGNRDMAYKWRSVYRENYGDRVVGEQKSVIGKQLEEYYGHGDGVLTTTNYDNKLEIERNEREKQQREKDEWERREKEAKDRENAESEQQKDAQSAAAAAAAAALERLRIAAQSSVTIAPAVDRWDATKFIPPIDSKPEAPDLTITHYENAWDKPNKPDSYQQPETHRSYEPEPVVSPSLFQFPKYGKSTSKIWQSSPQPPVERVFAEDLPPYKTKSKQVKKKSSSSSFSENLQNYDSSFNWSEKPDDTTTPQPGGFQFPKLGKSVIDYPWESKDRPKVERVYPEDLPPPAYQPIQSKYQQQFSKQRRESLEKTEQESEVKKLTSSTSPSSSSSSSSHHRHKKSSSESNRAPPNPSASRTFVLKPILKHPKKTSEDQE